MYEVIGINYERNTLSPSVIRVRGRTSKVLNNVYEYGRELWDSGICSKYLVALVYRGKLVDYNRPDYWNFEKKNKFTEETSHFSYWDYNLNPCPYSDKKYHNGEAHKYMSRMLNAYHFILMQEGVFCKTTIYKNNS